jgi:hypothetical protein
MPKNKGKGGKNRRRGKNENEGLKRELVFKEDGQEYAQVKPHLLCKIFILYFPHQSGQYVPQNPPLFCQFLAGALFVSL